MNVSDMTMVFQHGRQRRIGCKATSKSRQFAYHGLSRDMAGRFPFIIQEMAKKGDAVSNQKQLDGEVLETDSHKDEHRKSEKVMSRSGNVIQATSGKVKSSSTVYQDNRVELLKANPDVQAGMKMQEFRRSIAQQLKAWREAAGYTQVELAKVLGTTQKQVSRMESCTQTHNLTIDMVFKFAFACEKSIALVEMPVSSNIIDLNSRD